MKRSSRHSKERKLIPWFLSLLFCMLNGSSLFVCGMCFTVAIILLTTDRDVGSFVVLVFISLLSNLIISFYILINTTAFRTANLPFLLQISTERRALAYI